MGHSCMAGDDPHLPGPHTCMVTPCSAPLMVILFVQAQDTKSYHASQATEIWPDQIRSDQAEEDKQREAEAGRSWQQSLQEDFPRATDAYRQVC